MDKARRNERRRLNNAKRKANGLCRDCPNPREQGELCRPCMDKRAARLRRRYEGRKDAGLCPKCGKPADDDTSVYCWECAEFFRGAVSRSYHRHKPED